MEGVNERVDHPRLGRVVDRDPGTRHEAHGYVAAERNRDARERLGRGVALGEHDSADHAGTHAGRARERDRSDAGVLDQPPEIARDRTANFLGPKLRTDLDARPSAHGRSEADATYFRRIGGGDRRGAAGRAGRAAWGGRAAGRRGVAGRAGRAAWGGRAAGRASRGVGRASLPRSGP